MHGRAFVIKIKDEILWNNLQKKDNTKDGFQAMKNYGPEGMVKSTFGIPLCLKTMGEQGERRYQYESSS